MLAFFLDFQIVHHRFHSTLVSIAATAICRHIYNKIEVTCDFIQSFLTNIVIVQKVNIVNVLASLNKRHSSNHDQIKVNTRWPCYTSNRTKSTRPPTNLWLTVQPQHNLNQPNLQSCPASSSHMYGLFHSQCLHTLFQDLLTTRLGICPLYMN
jgi:hypothetical protein